MTRKQTNNEGGSTQEPTRVNFAIWTSWILTGHAVGMAFFVGIAGIVLGLRVRQLIVPYLALLSCAFVLSPALYWARLVRERPSSSAIRLTIGMFAYLQALSVAFLFSAIRLRVVPLREVLDYYYPFLAFSTALVSITLGVTRRRMFEASRPEQSRNETVAGPKGTTMGAQNPREREGVPRPRPASIGVMTGRSLVAHAIGGIILVAIFGLALGVPARRLLMPYVAVLFCGSLLSPLLYWAWLPHQRPRSFATRIGLAMFSYLQVLILALLLSAVRLGILSTGKAFGDYYRVWVLFSAVLTVGMYFVGRKMLNRLQEKRQLRM
jgi:hypothetical protein